MFWSDLRNMQHDCGCNVQFCWNLAERRRGNQSYYLISRVSRSCDPTCAGPVLWQWDINSSRAGQNICCSRQIPTVSYTYRPAPGYCWLLNWVHHYTLHCILTGTIQWSSIWTLILWRRILSLDLCAKVSQFYNGGGNLFNYPHFIYLFTST